MLIDYLLNKGASLAWILLGTISPGSVWHSEMTRLPCRAIGIITKKNIFKHHPQRNPFTAATAVSA